MTICGIATTGPDRATAWADSEVYTESRPDGFASKLFVHALAGIILTGTGPLAMLRNAADELQLAPDLDSLAESVASCLCRSAADCRDHPRIAAEMVDLAAVAAIGHSHRLGRMIGLVWRSPDFVPVITTAWCSPRADDGYADASDADAIIATAQGQLEVVRRTIPTATGGTLIVAEVQSGSVVTRPLFDLAGGTVLRRPPMLGGELMKRDAGFDGECPLVTTNPVSRRARHSFRAVAGKLQPEGVGGLSRGRCMGAATGTGLHFHFREIRL